MWIIPVKLKPYYVLRTQWFGTILLNPRPPYWVNAPWPFFAYNSLPLAAPSAQWWLIVGRWTLESWWRNKNECVAARTNDWHFYNGHSLHTGTMFKHINYVSDLRYPSLERTNDITRYTFSLHIFRCNSILRAFRMCAECDCRSLNYVISISCSRLLLLDISSNNFTDSTHTAYLFVLFGCAHAGTYDVWASLLLLSSFHVYRWCRLVWLSEPGSSFAQNTLPVCTKWHQNKFYQIYPIYYIYCSLPVRTHSLDGIS